MALGVTSAWWGPSVGAGYRPTALGPRPITGLGDAQGAPGWGTPFDEAVPANSPVNCIRALPVPPQSGLGGWGSVFEPVVDPGYVFKPSGPGTVKAQLPFFTRPMRNVDPRPWPLYPNRGSFEGPYGAHQLPFYVMPMQSGGEYPNLPGWPYLRRSNLGVQGQFLANVSRFRLPSPSYIHAHRRYATPGVSNTVSSFYPGAQAVVRKGPWDWKQDKRVGEVQCRRELL